MPFAQDLLTRFLRYIQCWTTSDSSFADNGVVPSTKQQWDLAHMLEKELKEVGVTDITVTDNCYVCARIPATKGMEHIPAVGFLAHLDTTEEVCGKNVSPNVIQNYDGAKIYLKENVVLDPGKDKDLFSCKGDTIITTDGTTLLGADDKAGIAIIMQTVSQILAANRDSDNVKIPHGTIEIVFSPDEETGHGMDKVPLPWFTAKQCYTVDGGKVGEIEAECFNAWKTEVTFVGKAMHTGSARPNMVNATTMACDFVSFLPRNESPEATDGYQGFYVPMEISGHIENATVTVFLRDFTMDGMERRKIFVEQLAKTVEKKYPGGKVCVKHTQQYLNMSETIAKFPKVMENLVVAVQKAGIEPEFKPIRGGTDGSRLTELGIPCPNIFTGGHNFHSRYEWVSLSQMIYGVNTLINLVAIQADN